MNTQTHKQKQTNKQFAPVTGAGGSGALGGVPKNATVQPMEQMSKQTPKRNNNSRNTQKAFATAHNRKQLHNVTHQIKKGKN